MNKKKYSSLLVIFAVLIILAAACASNDAAVDDALDGTSWQLEFYRKTTPIPGSTITARFADGEITGSAGCNTYGDPEGVMEQEQMYLEWLSDAYKYQLSDDQLQIFWTGQEALTFVPGD
jgi:heat shock protein HslJ